MSNNTAERAMRPVVTRRRNWPLAGSNEAAATPPRSTP
ncbi:IS66 family transposase [Reyranella soli]|nr:transposase [Reyranella soli]